MQQGRVAVYRTVFPDLPCSCQTFTGKTLHDCCSHRGIEPDWDRRTNLAWWVQQVVMTVSRRSYDMPYNTNTTSEITTGAQLHGSKCPSNTSSTAQGGGGSFKNRKPIGEVGCCESRMAERIHWWTDRWLELSFWEWLQWLQWSPYLQLLDVVWCSAVVVVVECNVV